FAQGVAELKAGKAIRYVGPGGPTSFDSFHDSPGIFQVDTYTAAGVVNVSGNITATQLRAVSGGYHCDEHSVSIFLASVGFGLLTAAVLAIAAVGFTLQFAVTNVLNLAFAAVMTAGAFTAYGVNQLGLSVWLGLPVAMAASAALSVALNLLVYAPFQ